MILCESIAVSQDTVNLVSITTNDVHVNSKKQPVRDVRIDSRCQQHFRYFSYKPGRCLYLQAMAEIIRIKKILINKFKTKCAKRFWFGNSFWWAYDNIAETNSSYMHADKLSKSLSVTVRNSDSRVFRLIVIKRLKRAAVHAAVLTLDYTFSLFFSAGAVHFSVDNNVFLAIVHSLLVWYCE